MRNPQIPDGPNPSCPKCGDPVVTSGCYPGAGICGGEDEYDDTFGVDDDYDDAPPNAGSAS